MRAILFGGSFDPIQIGHVKTVKELQKKFPQDTIVVLPGLNRFKPAGALPIEIRYQSVAATFKPFKNVVVLDWSLHSDTSSTYHNVCRLKEKYNEVLIVAGEEILETLSSWTNSEKLLKEKWVFCLRHGGKILNNISDPALKDLLTQSVICSFKHIDISSTEIRNGNKPLEKFIPKEALEIVRPYLRTSINKPHERSE